jgi:hypothetical protein
VVCWRAVGSWWKLIRNAEGLVRGVQKHHNLIKSMSTTFPKKIDKIFDVSFSSIFFVYRVFGCFSATGVKNTTKNVLQKIVSKSFDEKICKKPKIDFPQFF